MPWQPKGATVAWGAPGPGLPLGEERGCPLCFALLWSCLQHWVAVWVPQYKKDMKLLRGCLKEGYGDGEGLRGKGVHGAAKIPGFAQPRAEELRVGLMAAAASHRERGAVLSSALCDSDRA